LETYTEDDREFQIDAQPTNPLSVPKLLGFV